MGGGYLWVGGEARYYNIRDLAPPIIRILYPYPPPFSGLCFPTNTKTFFFYFHEPQKTLVVYGNDEFAGRSSYNPNKHAFCESTKLTLTPIPVNEPMSLPNRHPTFGCSVRGTRGFKKLVLGRLQSRPLAVLLGVARALDAERAVDRRIACLACSMRLMACTDVKIRSENGV